MTGDSQPPRRSPWSLLTTVITGIEILIGSISLITILILVFFQAVQRYLPISGIPWTGEVAQFCLVWLTFSVMGILVTRRGHIALEVLDTVKSMLVIRIVQTFALLIVAAVAAALVAEAWSLIETQGFVRSASLGIPMSYVYVFVFTGAISTCVRALISAVTIAIKGPELHDYDDSEVSA